MKEFGDLEGIYRHIKGNHRLEREFIEDLVDIVQ